MSAEKRRTFERRSPIFGKLERSMPPGIYADLLLKEAHSFLLAARALPESHFQACTRPLFSLLCQSIELGLKAFLSAKGLEASKLTKAAIRHDLEGLYAACLESGLQITDARVNSVIEVLSICHAGHVFRYPDVKLTRLPDPIEVADVIGTLLIDVRADVLNSFVRSLQCSRSELRLHDRWELRPEEETISLSQE